MQMFQLQLTTFTTTRLQYPNPTDGKSMCSCNGMRLLKNICCNPTKADTYAVIQCVSQKHDYWVGQLSDSFIDYILVGIWDSMPSSPTHFQETGVPYTYHWWSFPHPEIGRTFCWNITLWLSIKSLSLSRLAVSFLGICHPWCIMPDW